MASAVPSALVKLTSQQLLDTISGMLEGRDAAEAAVLRAQKQGDAEREQIAKQKLARMDALLAMYTNELRGI